MAHPTKWRGEPISIVPAGGRFLKPSRCRGRRPASPLQHRPVAGFVPGEDHNPDYRRVPQETTLSTHTCSGSLRFPGTFRDPRNGHPRPEDPGPRHCAAGGLYSRTLTLGWHIVSVRLRMAQLLRLILLSLVVLLRLTLSLRRGAVILGTVLSPAARQPPRQGQGPGPLASPVTQVMGRCYPPPLPPTAWCLPGTPVSLSVK